MNSIKFQNIRGLLQNTKDLIEILEVFLEGKEIQWLLMGLLCNAIECDSIKHLKHFVSDYPYRQMKDAKMTFHLTLIAGSTRAENHAN